MKRLALMLTVMMIAASATADDGCCSVGSDDKPPSRRYTGLSVFADAGAYWGDRATANFYSGRPENDNRINTILHSNTFGTQIWNNLTEQGLISSAVGSYNQLQVLEYPDMYYRTSFLYGLGFRYDYQSGFGWLLRFDLARLNAIGAFNLSATGGTGILGTDEYVRCGILGQEDRINIDFAVTCTMPLSDVWDLEIDIGGGINNTKVRENLMEIGGAKYSILDVWDGQTPDAGVGQYEYINQGGIGWNIFASALLGYQINGVGAIRVGYTIYHSRISLQNYSGGTLNHLLGVRFEINNFNVFGN